MGKGEIARYEQLLLFPQCFQKACFPGASKGVTVWEWVYTGRCHNYVHIRYPTIKYFAITRPQILDSSKLKEFSDDNFKLDESGRMLS